MTTLLARLQQEIGRYGVQVSQTKELAPSSELLNIFAELAAPTVPERDHLSDINLAISHLGQIYGLIEEGKTDEASDYCRCAADSWTQDIARIEAAPTVPDSPTPRTDAAEESFRDWCVLSAELQEDAPPPPDGGWDFARELELKLAAAEAKDKP